jgi:gluconokinase
LLESQLATLEIPKNALQIVNDRSPEEIVSEILTQLSSGKS